MSLARCYDEIKSLNIIPDERMDTLDVVKAVDKYRNFWKPERVRLVLLAESHKHTSDLDFAHSWGFPETHPLYRGNYVRFVYCLANGEKDLVRLDSNKGTWQFWKLLFSCLNQIIGANNVVPVLSKFTPIFRQRMREKIALLTSLGEAGIWLVDASIVGIAEEANAVKTEVIRNCWENHVGLMLRELEPRPRFIVVGRGVEKTLGKEIDRLDPDYEVIRQPNAHIRGGYPDYLKCFRACSRFID